MSGILEVDSKALVIAGGGGLLAGPLLARTLRKCPSRGGIRHHHEGPGSDRTLAVTSTFRGYPTEGDTRRN